MSKHTPTPWNLDNKKGKYISSINNKEIISDTHDGLIFGFEELSDKEIDANAAFIVKAVNCHDDLVNIAEWVKAAVEGNERTINNDLYNAAVEALAKAKGDA